MKGLFDEYKGEKEFLVTGSARLDYYRFGGDSLQGRYHYLRLHPISLAELKSGSDATLKDLLALGPFPEPFFKGSDTFARRWSQDYRDRLIREEVTQMESVSDLGKLEKLMLALPSRVGSLLSLNSLREDLEVAHKTVSRWMDALERNYVFFRIPPFLAKGARSIKKEQKAYLFDWTPIQGDGARMENLVAWSLLKWCHFQRDTQGYNMELNFYRDRDGREVDFIVTQNTKPIWIIECKSGQKTISPALKNLKQKYPQALAFQLHLGKEDFERDHVRVMPTAKFLSDLV
jgi:predicted AAA+ superfamily ATPase